MTASTTDARRKATTKWSPDDGATIVRGPPGATIHTEVAVTTVGKTAVLLLSHLALGFLVEPSALLISWPDFGNRPTS